MAAVLYRRRVASLRVLGLNADASTQSVRETYLRLAKTHHPDLAAGCKAAAEDRFKQIADAYELLSGKNVDLSARAVAQQYEDLMAQRAQEPFIIRWFWRGPNIGIKFRIKLGVMVALLLASLIDQQGRESRNRGKLKTTQ